jgi:hypothetical protein
VFDDTQNWRSLKLNTLSNQSKPKRTEIERFVKEGFFPFRKTTIQLSPISPGHALVLSGRLEHQDKKAGLVQVLAKRTGLAPQQPKKHSTNDAQH